MKSIRGALRLLVALSIGALIVGGSLVDQAQRPTANPIGAGPFLYKTGNMQYRAVVVTRELDHPWGMAFLPDGTILVTERPGRLRVIRNGVLDPNPVAGLPPIYADDLDGLLDIALHPQFAANKFVYISYSKPGPDLAPGAERFGTRVPAASQRKNPTGKTMSDAVLRAKWDGQKLTDIHDIFVDDNVIDDSVSQASGVRLAFGRDGKLYMSTGAPNAPSASGKYARSRGGRAQDPTNDGGKVLRLNDDGTIPQDNPFVGRAGYKPEIYTMGHRNILGMAMNPATGEIWEDENGPQDDDKVNILKPGANYGWPIVGFGHDYTGDFIGGPLALGDPAASNPDARSGYLPGMEQPFLFWVPAVAPSGMAFYTGDRFPQWDGSLFIGVLKYRRLERHSLNDKGLPVRRDYLLEDLKQRIRDVRQGPDGMIYVLTDENPGALLRIEPVTESATH
jgi:glucose/arabinose dehydrogenase